MKTYSITDDIYREMVARAKRYEDCVWDSIELADGCAVTFELKNGKPYDVEVFDADDNQMDHDFCIFKFETMAA